MNKSFTLIELLIVIGILAVLVVTILITLNPSEAQKKARDVKRIKDLAALEAIALQWINDGNPPIDSTLCSTHNAIGSVPAVCYSTSAGQVKSQPCNNNWLNVNLCNYTNSVPVDPLNSIGATYICGGSVSNPQTCSQSQFAYTFYMNGSDYKIGVLQESKANAGNVLNKTGSYNAFVIAASNPNLW